MHPARFSPRPESHLSFRPRLDLAPKLLESRLSHQLMTQLDLKFSLLKSATCTVTMTIKWRGDEYTVRPENEANLFFVSNIFYVGRFWWNLVRSFLLLLYGCWRTLSRSLSEESRVRLNKVATKICNVFHLTWIMSLHYLWNLKCSSSTCYHWGVRERNSRIYSTLFVASKFNRFETSWLQSVENVAKEGVQNTHHWSGPTETATENGVGPVEVEVE